MSNTSLSGDGLPACGLYRTTQPLPGGTAVLPADHLVYFHNHSTQGPPVVLLPESNEHNRWRFQERGFLVAELVWVASLRPLLPEGFYILRTHLRVSDRTLPEKSLVQLGYNRQGEPIIFPARRVDNALVFPSRGFRFVADTLFAQLQTADFVVQEPPQPEPEQTLLH
jgi:hypothetical protein